MTHYVFMKFEKGYLTPETSTKISDTFESLSKALTEEIISATVRLNCVEREANMDLMIKMELKSEKSLPIYLNHPLHVGIGREMNPHIVNRASFDCE